MSGTHDGTGQAADPRSGKGTPARLVSTARAVARVTRAAYRKPERRPDLPKDLKAAVGRAWRAEPSTAPAKKPAAKTAASPPATAQAPDRLAALGIPEVPTPDGPTALPDLKVAVILDTFSELAFRYEWNHVTFTPTTWRKVLTEFEPQLLFVEATWSGKDGAWAGRMTKPEPSPVMVALTEWCRERSIPTVFWNKEDPPNYQVFLATAKLFDHVFTVDANTIPDYHRDLGHDRVHLLPFAAQPRIHNPVRRGKGRVHEVAFAGTYFAEKHPDRRVQMEQVVAPALSHGLHIYSRKQNDGEKFQFPEQYRPNIVGTLPYERMLGAYTSYKVFLNVNSVTESPTMCARRLFELSAAQTAIVSGAAAAIEPFFGANVEVVGDERETDLALRALLQHEELRARRGLRAHRMVFDRHLYSHRVDTVLQTAGLPVPERRSQVSVIVSSNRPHRTSAVLEAVGRQTHPDVELVYVQHGFAHDEATLREDAKQAGITNLVVLAADAALTLGAALNLGIDAASGDVVTKMDDDDHYGPNYLLDLVRALDYTDAAVVGKWAYYSHLEASGATVLRFPAAEHRFTDLVVGGTMTMRTETAKQFRFADIPRAVDTELLGRVRAAGATVYSADRFNFFLVRRSDVQSHTFKIAENELLAKKGRLVFYGDPRVHVEV